MSTTAFRNEVGEATNARPIYTHRLAALTAERDALAHRDRRFGLAKLIVAAIAVICALWLARLHPTQLAWALVPALLFIALWIAHERLLRRLDTAKRLAAYYTRGLARLDGTWASQGDSGKSFLDPEHLYAGDLDLFGSGSLYELISEAASVPGRRTLAQWLLNPAPPAEVAARQQAIRELAPRLDLREQLALAAGKLHDGTPEAILAWAGTREDTVPRWLLFAAPPLIVAWFATLVLWLATDNIAWFVTVSVLNMLVTTRGIARIRAASEATLAIFPLLGPLHPVLAVFEAQPFEAPRLRALTEAIRSDGLAPSRALKQLVSRLDWLASTDNWFVKLINRFVFWTPLCVYAAESWRRRHGSRVPAWLQSIGDFEALTSLAAFSFEHPAATWPTLAEGDATFRATALTHPLLPATTAVANDVALDHAEPLIIVSGPNMAGKSTLLRAIGLNTVLAQCGAPVCCGCLALTPLAIAASISVQDSLQGGLSRFYAEIQRLKRITDLAATRPTLFLLDELLSGTNSHDRRVGTEALLRGLLARHALGIITTHDLALTAIVEVLDAPATNMHFGDTYKDGALAFDYRLTPGIADSTNALELMRSIGLEV